MIYETDHLGTPAETRAYAFEAAIETVLGDDKNFPNLYKQIGGLNFRQIDQLFGDQSSFGGADAPPAEVRAAAERAAASLREAYKRFYKTFEKASHVE